MKPTSHPSTRRQSGFTLIEIIVVIGIILLLAGLTIGSMSYINRKKSESKAEIQIALLSNALDRYNADFGVYPDGDGGESSTADLRKELYPPEEGGEGINKNTVYLSDLGETNPQGWNDVGGSDVIIDPYGNPYRYRSPGMENPDFDLWSIGSDEQTGTSDDITNW